LQLLIFLGSYMEQPTLIETSRVLEYIKNNTDMDFVDLKEHLDNQMAYTSPFLYENFERRCHEEFDDVDTANQDIVEYGKLFFENLSEQLVELYHLDTILDSKISEDGQMLDKIYDYIQDFFAFDVDESGKFVVALNRFAISNGKTLQAAMASIVFDAFFKNIYISHDKYMSTGQVRDPKFVESLKYRFEAYFKIIDAMENLRIQDKKSYQMYCDTVLPFAERVVGEYLQNDSQNVEDIDENDEEVY